MIPTGLAVAIPEGHAGLVLPRSGLASKHGLTLANAPGLIDAGLPGRGRSVPSSTWIATEPVRIAKGDRIAQLVIVAIPEVKPTLGRASCRRHTAAREGFGSTGTASWSSERRLKGQV